MSAVLSAVLATLCLAVCADAQTHTLAVHQDSGQLLESTVGHELGQELQRLLAPAGLRVTWQAADQHETAATFEKLVVASFDGDCSVAELPVTTLPALQTNKLADAVVGSDGQVRPFFHLDCARLIGTLRPLLDHVNVPMRNRIFGRAMARVMAHEIYHILAQATDHAESGVAKPSLSLENLIADRFDFSLPSLDRIRRNVSPEEDQINRQRIALNLTDFSAGGASEFSPGRQAGER